MDAPGLGVRYELGDVRDEGAGRSLSSFGRSDAYVVGEGGKGESDHLSSCPFNF